MSYFYATFSTGVELKIDHGHPHMGIGSCYILALEENMMNRAGIRASLVDMLMHQSKYQRKANTYANFQNGA